ncbi:amino acid ABC transporter ATP-binding protein [Desulfonema ishimotonii]|uniref:Amino acid ABC transporter ATP-binding protein n=1 Tax=Desulfonema ishimotonii TaxID=45657 RepID=A0A401FWD7_9BACT|nr:amino acid ABC transporter ATP-binding protein [Desulfonema ishimotonii]GBC61271.1 amino acid ABC transporter ATP-binding protein [Desulfonema ishimotonii]
MKTANHPILKIDNIYKRFGENTILKDVSLSIRKGEIKVLIGPSGAGKSTFLQSINFLVMPDEGTIRLEDRPVDPSDKRAICAYRRQVGMIFQEFNLFDHLTALGNVEIGMVRVLGMRKKAARERAMAELDRVGLKDQADQYPAQLSGGQKQRVSIARALAMDPRVMLLDEPTSALDPELIGEVQAVIRDLGKGGMTMIMATHQIGFARSLADEIIFMEKGAIIEQGPPDELLAPGACTRTGDFCSRIAEIGGE